MGKTICGKVMAFCVCTFFFWSFVTQARAQVPVVTLEKQIPVHFWTLEIEPWWLLDAVRDGVETFVEEYHIVDDPAAGSSAGILFASEKRHADAVKSQTGTLKMPGKNLKSGDVVYLPPLFGLHLLKRGDKYGLLTTGGNIVVLPVYDQMAFLYANHPEWGSVLLPMLIVYKGGRYALMDPSGFLVSRFCDTEEEIPSAYIVSKANEFKITDTVQPEELWGF